MKVKHRLNEKVSNIFAEVKGDASFLDFAGYDGLITEGEKSAAERGAAARGTYGAKRDRCKKGKSCSSACIFYRKDCVLELPVNVQNAIRGARKLIRDKMERGEISERDAQRMFLQTTGIGKRDSRGRISREDVGKAAKDVVWEKKGDKLVRAKGAAQGKAPAGQARMKEGVGASKADLEQRRADVAEALRGSKDKSIKGLREEFPNQKERQAKVKEMLDLALEKGYGIYGEKGQYRAKRPEEMSEEFAKGVLKNQPFIKKMESIEAELKAGKLTAQQYNEKMNEVKTSMFERKATNAEILLMSAFLSPEARSYLMTAGTTQAGNIYEGRFPGRTAMPVSEEVGKNKETQKAWMMQNLKFMVETNFKEVYSGVPYKIHQVDLEHLTPEAFAKPYGAANVGGNKSFAFSKANQTRGNDSLSFFLADNPKGMFGGKIFNQDGTRVQTGNSRSSLKGQLERDISQKSKDVNTLLATVASIPAKDLSAKDRASTIAKIVSEHTAINRSVTVGMETARGEKSYHWFGGKTPGWSGAAGLGEKIATSIGKWEKEGDAGSAKMIALKGLMDRTRNGLLKINELEANGQPIRRQIVSAPGVKEIREKEFESRMQSLMPEFNALLGS